VTTVVLAFSGGLDTSFCVSWLRSERKARVITVTVDTGGFSPEELTAIEARARALGADDGVNYATADWGKAVREWTGRRGVDVVLDNVGAATWAGSLRALASGGRLVTCGATTGPIGETDIRIVFWRHLRIIGSTMASRAETRQAMSQLFAGRLKPIVDRTFPLAETPAALALLQKGEQFGKIVVTA
jgi:NADPH:quinone reductase-like Zn-dependent oxidoreductase